MLYCIQNITCTEITHYITAYKMINYTFYNINRNRGRMLNNNLHRISNVEEIACNIKTKIVIVIAFFVRTMHLHCKNDKKRRKVMQHFESKQSLIYAPYTEKLEAVLFFSFLGCISACSV